MEDRILRDKHCRIRRQQLPARCRRRVGQNGTPCQPAGQPPSWSTHPPPMEADIHSFSPTTSGETDSITPAIRSRSRIPSQPTRGDVVRHHHPSQSSEKAGGRPPLGGSGEGTESAVDLPSRYPRHLGSAATAEELPPASCLCYPAFLISPLKRHRLKKGVRSLPATSWPRMKSPS